MPPSEISEVQSDILREQIVPEFLALLGDAATLEHPAELEHLAGTLLIPLAQPELAPEVASAVVEALEVRGDANAAGVLAAFAVLAPEPLAGQAHASAQRLAEEGIVSPAAAGVGTLDVQEAVRIESANAELLVVLLARPGERDLQAAILGIEHHETGGALVDCGLTPPAPVSEARELLDGVEGAAAPQPRAASARADRSAERGPDLALLPCRDDAGTARADAAIGVPRAMRAPGHSAASRRGFPSQDLATAVCAARRRRACGVPARAGAEVRL